MDDRTATDGLPIGSDRLPIGSAPGENSPDLRMLSPAELAAGLRGLAQHRDAGNLSAMEAALCNAAATYIAGATDSLREHMAEVGRLRAALRVNGLRAGATHAEIDEVIHGKR